MERFELVVPGEAVPNERARRGAGGRWYTPSATLEYRKRVQAAWLQAGRPSLRAAPVTVSASFYVSRPPSHFGTGRNSTLIRGAHAAKLPPGDVDNYLKGVLDALNTRAWGDDNQVVTLSGVSKFWADADGPRTVIRAWRAHVTEIAA